MSNHTGNFCVGKTKASLFAGALFLLSTASCQDVQTEREDHDRGPDAAAASQVSSAVIPDHLAPFGDGYPANGDPCRRLGESAATVNYLDDSAILVGCPNAESAAALGGKIVNEIAGVLLVSISTGDANAGMQQ